MKKNEKGELQMDNNETNENIDEGVGEGLPKKKSYKMLFIILGGVLVFILAFTLLALNSPKVKAKLILGKTTSVLADFTKIYDNDLMELFNNESHESETKVDVDISIMEIKGEIKTAYDKKTNSGLLELSLLDFISLGAYIDKDEFALGLSDADEMLVYDFQSDVVFEEGLTLFEHISKLTPSDTDSNLKEYEIKMMEKMLEYSNKSISIIPVENISNVKGTIEIFDEEKNVKGIEFTFTGKELVAYLEELLIMIKEDEEVKEIYDASLLDLNSEISPSLSTDYEPLDYESAIEELIADLAPLEKIDELNVIIYYINLRPVAINLEVKEETINIDMLSTFFVDGSDYYGALDGDFTQSGVGGKIIAKVSKEDRDVHILFDAKDAGLNIRLDIVEDENNLLIVDGGFIVGGGYQGEYVATISGEVKSDDVITEGLIEITYFENGNEILTALLDYNKKEVRRNKNYTFDAGLVISMDGQEITIVLENEIVFGEEAKADIPTWSESNDEYYTDIDEFVPALEEYLFSLLWMF